MFAAAWIAIPKLYGMLDTLPFGINTNALNNKHYAVSKHHKRH